MLFWKTAYTGSSDSSDRKQSFWVSVYLGIINGTVIPLFETTMVSFKTSPFVCYFCIASCNYLKHCWLIGNCTYKNNVRWKLNKKHTFSFKVLYFKTSTAKYLPFCLARKRTQKRGYIPIKSKKWNRWLRASLLHLHCQRTGNTAVVH